PRGAPHPDPHAKVELRAAKAPIAFVGMLFVLLRVHPLRPVGGELRAPAPGFDAREARRGCRLRRRRGATAAGENGRGYENDASDIETFRFHDPAPRARTDAQ